MRRLGYLTSLLIVLTTGLSYALSAPTTAPQTAPQSPAQRRELSEADRQAYLAMIDDIQYEVSRTSLTSLAALADRVQKEWVEKNPEIYGRLMAQIVGELDSENFHDERQRDLKAKYGFLALEHADQMPADVEADIVQNMLEELDGGFGGSPKERAALRKRTAVLWFHAWKRVEGAVDPTWDEEKESARIDLEAIATEAGLISMRGRPPEAIADPALRQRYVEGMEENRRRNQRRVQQIDARRLANRFLPWAEKAIITGYSMEPTNLEELQRFLKDNVQDGAVRERILEKVKAATRGSATSTSPSR